MSLADAILNIVTGVAANANNPDSGSFGNTVTNGFANWVNQNLGNQEAQPQATQEQAQEPVYYTPPVGDQVMSYGVPADDTLSEEQAQETKKAKETKTTAPGTEQGTNLFDILMGNIPDESAGSFSGSSGGGSFGFTPEAYQEAVQNVQNPEELSALNSQFWQDQSKNMGEAAGFVMPGNAPVKIADRFQDAGSVMSRFLDNSPELVNIADKDAEILKSTFPEAAENVINSLGPNAGVLGLDEVGVAIPKAEDAIKKSSKPLAKFGENAIKQADEKLAGLSGVSGAKKALVPAVAGGLLAGAATNEDVLNSASNTLDSMNNKLNEVAGVQESNNQNTDTATAPLNERFTPEELENMTQRELFERYMEDQGNRDYYSRTYGEDILGPHGYEVFRDNGSNTDYEGKYDLVRDLFGFNPEVAGIDQWRNMAETSGINMNNEDQDATIRAIMDYMWAPENIINTAAYLSNADYANNRSLGNLDSVYNYMMYLQDQQGDMLNQYGLGLDARDAAEYTMIADAMNRMRNGYGFTDKDMGLANWLMEQSGDTGGFGFVNDDNKSEYGKTDWNVGSDTTMSPSDLYMLTSQNPNTVKDYLQQTGYFGPGVASPLIDKDMADQFMSMIQENTGRQTGRKAGE